MNEAPPRGIDYERLLPWFREHVAAVDSLHAEVIGHGRSNITYRVSSGDQSWVLRRPPLSHVMPTAHDMKREFRVISALRPTEVPIPDAIALCEDLGINDAPFYVMSYVSGMVPTDPSAVAAKYDAPTQRRMGEELVDTLALLHALNPADVGLADFGKPQGYIERQVRRFSGQIEQHRTRDVPELEELARRLSAWIPPESDAAIVHGDYRLDNCVIDDDGHIAAVLDWEMATLGDPLADVGSQYMYWAGSEAGSATQGIAGAVTALPAFLKRDEAMRRYAEKSGRDVSNLDFYIVLAYFRLAVILEGIYARFLEGGTVGAGFEMMGAQATNLAKAGLAIASASKVASLRGA
ncbi:MAG TPA: phosphotransferase family protein [Dehalococcoidia bacterium]|nr:phosphotransferase family protein [Dehalococcoidia bacterium]